ncbi:MAG: autotransporter outer membrane beta-barrel domain-containing protein, partial [Desulfovibrio sp.]|nr:autotransporter outer membrane beta-barrel domain-containing protein [Desulfovibrio sp.]
STTLRGVSASEGKIQTIKHGSLLEAVVRYVKSGNDFYAEVVRKNSGSLNVIQPMSSAAVASDNYDAIPIKSPIYAATEVIDEFGNRIIVCGIVPGSEVESEFEVTLIDGETGEVIPRSTTLTTLASSIDLADSADSVETTDLTLPSNDEDAESLVSGSESITRSNIVGIALANQGADLAAGKGMESAVNAAKKDAWGAFGAVSAGSTRYNNIDVDASSVNVIAGISRGVDTEIGQLTTGVFFEYGSNAYDTHGSGNASYMGGGILGRADFKNLGNGHFYAEASARLGGLSNDFDSNVLFDGWGRKASYDSQTTYYGGHLGAGYELILKEDLKIDFYGKYFWLHQDEDDLRISTGEKVKFDAVSSSRLRGGMRATYAINEQITPYIGVAIEHEFDGKARASVYDYSLKTANIQGDTGIGEIGLIMKPSDKYPWIIDLGVQGYTGQREGIGGSLRIGFEF